jgi:hypothetical protein
MTFCESAIESPRGRREPTYLSSLGMALHSYLRQHNATTRARTLCHVIRAPLYLRFLFVVLEPQVTPISNVLEQRHDYLCNETLGEIRDRLTTIVTKGRTTLWIRSVCINQQGSSRGLIFGTFPDNMDCFWTR